MTNLEDVESSKLLMERYELEQRHKMINEELNRRSSNRVICKPSINIKLIDARKIANVVIEDDLITKLSSAAIRIVGDSISNGQVANKGAIELIKLNLKNVLILNKGKVIFWTVESIRVI